MKLIKLNVLESLVTNDKAEEVYINADNIIRIRQSSNYSEIDVAYPGTWRIWKVQETVEEIQYQLEDKPINKPRVGVRIKDIRLEKGMSMEEFGKRFNTSKATVNNWEKGRNLPNKENLKIIADLAGITVQKLLEG
nr:MAG TPA: helix-turn-helix domain protein [Caudoviricetes sp.]